MCIQNAKKKIIIIISAALVVLKTWKNLKNKEVKERLESLVTKTPLSKIPLLEDHIIWHNE